MRTSHIAAVILLTAVVSKPAFAAMESLGMINVPAMTDRDIIYASFGGSVEGLQFRASESDVTCRSIVATFGNGRSRLVFSGRLNEGEAFNIDLPGNERLLKSIAFTCHAHEVWGGKVRILADVGRYRSEWRSSPDWKRLYSKKFSWGGGVTQ